MDNKTDVEQGKSSKYDELEINSIIRTGLSKKEFEVIKFFCTIDSMTAQKWGAICSLSACEAWSSHG
jgi:hypothetical protein